MLVASAGGGRGGQRPECHACMCQLLLLTLYPVPRPCVARHVRDQATRCANILGAAARFCNSLRANVLVPDVFHTKVRSPPTP